ncbi:dTDP-4-dehydrorhamnose reductase [Paenibacillus rigui]|uniref:dTDP-4-dehydrorhamnose reductase n=1 Tax=Paenibacillus rigui TaxID=554312 RepID=A0A229UZ49_9BACL|nr:dTDP-4-dehydrorhamnose reductase [Paenibacillus rigui]OXM88405.1 dTDP-4-dehydrorhamnose reductase [Paenibacillus rigui]
MRVLVTGAGGQLGYDVVRLFQPSSDVIGLGRDELDITNTEQCIRVLEQHQPDVVIHCAAYTSVDLAEQDEDTTFAVNAYGARNMAVAAERIGAKMCYISTDYVFDGNTTVPYKEYDQPNPLGVYGKSKLAGERMVESLSSKYFIVRTSWVYGLHGHNFVKTMLKLAQDKKSLKVVHDQIGSPTFTEDLAKFLLQLVGTEKYGIYHATNSGSCSWYEFALAIFEEFGLEVVVEPCTTEEYPRPALRPKYSILDHSALRANGFEDLRHWREGLKVHLNHKHSQ